MATSGLTTFTITEEEAISMAMLEIGALAIGETPTQDETTDARRRLNLLLKSLQTSGIFINKLAENSFTTSLGVLNYAAEEGTVRILNCWMRVEGIDIPLDVFDYASYASIQSKSGQAQPTAVFVDYSGATPIFYCYPSPEGAYTIYYRRTTYIEDMTASTDEFDLPQYGLEMIVKGLACKLAPSYRVDPNERAMLKSEFEQAKREFLSFHTARTGKEIVIPKNTLIV
jgi:hypothetical protein